MEDKKEFKIKFYTEDEIKKIIKDKNEHLYYVDTGIDEVIVREQDLPDVIVSFNRNIEIMDLKIYDEQKISMDPVITTYGEFLEKAEPNLRDKIIDRLNSLQMGEKEPKDFKIIDEDMYEKVKQNLEKQKERNKRNKEAR